MHEIDLLLLKKKLLLLKKRKLRAASNPKRWPVRPVWLQRKKESEYFTAMRKLRESGDTEYFTKYFRMLPDTFDRLHRLVESALTKEYLCREPISSGERLALTLRYLSSAMDLKDVAMAYRMGLETAREAILLTCTALWEILKERYMKPPTTIEWQEIAAGFMERWQFPNCLGAVDGKHVKITAPKRSGTTYFNYKV
ncbi:uncharacterized protein LOC135378005 [Ornithodoros turicata]|uniref:uncharacterized protein LOC135378005 n=1 Tax=Ornithodoros turicata TaxID=34597 RepID=UPI003139119B